MKIRMRCYAVVDDKRSGGWVQREVRFEHEDADQERLRATERTHRVDMKIMLQQADPSWDAFTPGHIYEMALSDVTPTFEGMPRMFGDGGA